MATFELPNELHIRCQKALREAGFAEFTLPTQSLSPEGLLDFLYAGAYTRHTAGTTHLFDKARKAGQPLPSKADWERYTADFVSKYTAPEFVSRKRAAETEEELNDEERAFLMAVSPKLYEYGIARRASKAKGITALSPLEVIGDFADRAEMEQRVGEIAADYLRKEHGMDEEHIPAAVENSLKKLREAAKAHLASIRAQAKVKADKAAKGNMASF